MKIQPFTAPKFVFTVLFSAVTIFSSLLIAQLDNNSFNSGDKAEPSQDEASVTKASPSKDVITIRGVLDPIETLRLATRDPGIIKEILVREGDVVVAGQTIAILDDEMFNAEVSAANNELEIARQETKNDVDLQYAKISSEVNEKVLTRSRGANQQFAKAVSKTEIERLRLEYERSRLSGLQAERQQAIHQLSENLKSNQVKIAEIRLRNRTIKSQIDGTVVEVLNTPGEFVNSGQPIARVLNLHRLRVICAGSAKKFDPNNISDEAIFKVKLNGEVVSYPAKITFISPEIDPVRQTFGVWAEIQNTDNKLRSGNVGELELRLK